MNAEETEWVQRFRRGAPGGFETLYSVYGDRLYRFCYRLCGRAADAEDLAQEAFLAAYQGRERFQGRASIGTWLFRIALYRWRQRPASERNRPSPLDSTGGGMAAEDPTQARLEQMVLEAALSSLNDDLREAFLLVKAEGFKYREAAEILGVPQGTVQYRVSEAASRLRTALSAETQPEPTSADARRSCGKEAPDAV